MRRVRRQCGGQKQSFRIKTGGCGRRLFYSGEGIRGMREDKGKPCISIPEGRKPTLGSITWSCRPGPPASSVARRKIYQFYSAVARIRSTTFRIYAVRFSQHGREGSSSRRRTCAIPVIYPAAGSGVPRLGIRWKTWALKTRLVRMRLCDTH
jgi:hypothetical protein